MFISKAEKASISYKLQMLNDRLTQLENRYPYGVCKDGTPKKKPGPKGPRKNKGEQK